MVTEMMAAADVDGDGEVDFGEFKVIIRAGPDPNKVTCRDVLRGIRNDIRDTIASVWNSFMEQDLEARPTSPHLAASRQRCATRTHTVAPLPPPGHRCNSFSSSCRSAAVST